MHRLAVFLLCVGCGSDGATFDYPLDDVLRMNHVQAKGTHNSYHIDPGIDFEPWNYTHAPLDVQLESQGVRQFELDLYFFDNPPVRVEVHHMPTDYQSTCPQFADCMALVAAWSAAHPAHAPIVILLEPKDTFDAARAAPFFAEIEKEILSAFPRTQVITPAEVRGDAASVREAVTTRGWPTLGATRGRVMFVLLESGDYRAALPAGLIFSANAPGDGFMLFDDAITDQQAIRDAVAQGLMVRTRSDADGAEARANDRTRLDAALTSGAQFLSTDFPVPFPATGYVADVPGGTPARCNPLTAPQSCTPAAIENPAFLR